MQALVIEPDLSTRLVLEGELGAAGHRVRACQCLDEAMVPLASGERVDLAFVSVPLDASRTRVLQWVRALRETCGEEVTIVVVGSGWTAGLLDETLAAGADDYLERPVPANLFRMRLRVMERRLTLRRARRKVTPPAAPASVRPAETNRPQHQAALAALAQCALVGMDIPVLLAQATGFVTQVMEVDHSCIAEMQSSGDLLVANEAEGRDGGRESIAEGAVPGTAEGSALRDQPVIVADWGAESRFQMAPWARRLGIRSTLCVGISGVHQPYGVLGAHSKAVRAFSEDDVHFLQAVASILSMAVERKRTEEAIRQLAEFPERNPNPILECDRSGGMTYANPSAIRLAQALGCQSPIGLLPDTHETAVRDCLETGESRLYEQATRGGRTLEWSFFPVPELGAVHAYAEDITDRLALESQLRQLQKMECVGQLAAGLAHDFNNVLTIVRGHTDLLLLDSTQPPKRLASLNKILGAVERATNLTRQLLTFSRRQVIQARSLDINACVSEVIRMLDRVLGESISVRFEASANLPPVAGDAGMLEQVIMNLALNARDAMPSGGDLVVTTNEVTLTVEEARKRSEARPGRHVCLAMTDTGCGMDEATLRRLFEPFFTTKGVGKGTGLGLATVYGIVKQHHGWLEVTSTVGRGSMFQIFFPAAELSEDGAPVPVEKAAAVSVPDPPESVLLVEDEPNLRQLARIVLEDEGYTVVEAGSGVDALKVWSKRRDEIGLLLTDLVMPEGISGIELGRLLTAEKPSLKVIYTSGYSSDIVGRDVPRDESFCFLQKPYPAQTLLRLVRERLDLQGAGRG